MVVLGREMARGKGLAKGGFLDVGTGQLVDETVTDGGILGFGSVGG